MAQLTIRRCKVCTKPLPADTTKCPKCGAEHQIVPEIVNPLKFTPAQSVEYRQLLEEQVRNNPSDTNSWFGMGLVYLGLKNYELAQQNLKKAVDFTPGEPDVYYYYALSLFNQRSPTLLSNQEAERIEMWLQTAINIQPKRKYLILEMLLLQGAFKGKGKTVPIGKPEPEELLQRALVTVQEEDELKEIEQHVSINDDRNQEFIKQLKGLIDAKNNISSNTLLDARNAYADLCQCAGSKANDLDITEDGVARLKSEEERYRFFRGIFKPETPNYESQRSYIGPFFKSIVHLIVGALILLIALVVISFTGWIKNIYIHPTPVEKEFAALSQVKKYDKKDLGKKLKDFKTYRQSDIKREATFYENYHVLGYSYWIPEEGQVEIFHAPSEEDLSMIPQNAYNVKLLGVVQGNKMYVLLVLLLAGPLYFIIRMLIEFFRRSRERKEIKDYNSQLKRDYKENLQYFNERPTYEDYKKFCQLFVGPNRGEVPMGDMIEEGLRQANIKENDIINGKIFLCNFLFDCDTDGVETNDASVVLRYMGVNIAVAMPDQVLFITGAWDTLYNTMPKFNISSIMYNQIAMFKKTEDQILLISNNGSELTPITTNWGTLTSLFQYQDVNPKDELTYSRTRTSDREVFYRSLIDMHGRYSH